MNIACLGKALAPSASRGVRFCGRLSLSCSQKLIISRIAPSARVYAPMLNLRMPSNCKLIPQMKLGMQIE